MKRFHIILLLILFVQLAAAQKNKPKENEKTSEEDYVFTRVENDGGFPGGESKWQKFVAKNFDFNKILRGLPDSIKEYRDSVSVQFIITKDGMVQEIKFNSSAKAVFKDEIFRIIRLQSTWIPANACGRNVKAYRSYFFAFFSSADHATVSIKEKKFVNF